MVRQNWKGRSSRVDTIAATDLLIWCLLTEYYQHQERNTVGLDSSIIMNMYPFYSSLAIQLFQLFSLLLPLVRNYILSVRYLVIYFGYSTLLSFVLRFSIHFSMRLELVESCVLFFYKLQTLSRKTSMLFCREGSFTYLVSFPFQILSQVLSLYLTLETLNCMG